MDSINYVAKLNEYVQKSRCELKYDDVGSEGPAHIKTFTQRVILNGKPYPEGVGKNKKEARQNAAKKALGVLETDSNNFHDSCVSTRESTETVSQPMLTQPNYICWLNEHSQKNRVSISASESTALERGHAKPCCRFVVGGTEYPTGFGRNKKEAKEEAAMLAYQEICGNPPSKAVDQSVSVEPSSHQTNELNQDISEATGLSPGGTLRNMEVSIRELGLTEPNYIGLLNHHCQKILRHLDFSLVNKCGPAHCPQFFYRVVIDGKDYPEVEGKTAKEAKQGAAKEAWAVLQEQSDWDSKSAVSEEDAPSNPATSELASHNTSSSCGIKFQNTSEPPKAEKLGSKAKIKLAVNFTNAPKEQIMEIKNTTTQNSPTSPTSYSRFSNDYDNIEPIGKGGFGRVYKARLKHLNKYYAVKKVPYKGKALREPQLLADLQHPNIVRYYTSWIGDSDDKLPIIEGSSSSQSSTDASGQHLYIQMELCEAKNLQVWIDEKNRLHPDPTRGKESLDIMRKIISGVEYVHSKNLIHRDLKPSNIMVGSNGEVKIVDFGLVTPESDEDGNMLEKTMRTGTRSYMAPEQSNKNQYDKKVDIFALGLVYFLMLWNMSGHERFEIWGGIKNQTFPAEFKEKFPNEHHIIDSMLHKNPKFRPSAKEIQDKLEGSDLSTGKQSFLREIGASTV